MNQEDYQQDFDYDNTQWDDDDILSVLNEETIVEDFDTETTELLKSF